MEKVKSLISIITSILFILTAVLLFSCGEKRTVEEKSVVSGDTITTITKEDTNDSIRPVESTNYKEESNKLKEKLDNLAKKAKMEGGDLGRKINTSVDKLEAERKQHFNDTTKNDFKEKWKAFKEKANNAVDSLDKKFEEKIK